MLQTAASRSSESVFAKLTTNGEHLWSPVTQRIIDMEAKDLRCLRGVFSQDYFDLLKNKLL